MAAILRHESLAMLRHLSSRDGEEATLRFKSLLHPFTFRHTASHADGIIQNIFRGEYDRLHTVPKPSVIVDAGAFIGDLTCHWATKHPAARIIALEPNPENHRFATINVGPYSPRVTLLNLGLWSCKTKLAISGSEMGSQLGEAAGLNNASIETTDVPSLMHEHSLASIDILKLDIEGAEQQVLGPGCESWLPRVRILIVEMHGQHIEDQIVTRLRAAGFGARRYRSLVYFERSEA